jgi:Undecaprenyl-phosphate glucose phosphotransferase
MLYRHSEIFRTLLLVADLGIIGLAWLAAYWIRFETGIPAPLGVPEIGAYVEALVAILPLYFVLFRMRNLYEPRRTSSLVAEMGDLVHASTVGVVILVAISFFVRSYFYSRGVILIFYGLSTVSLIGLRLSIRIGLREARRRGYNLRFVVVAGAGDLAEEVIDRIHATPEAGLRVREVVGGGGRSQIGGVPVTGDYDTLKQALGRERVDQVIVALPREDSHQLEKLLAQLEDEVVSVRLVPDLMHVMTLRSSVEDLHGLPMIGLREGPLVGWAAVGKRVFDVVVSLAALSAVAPAMAAIALAIRASGGRPVLFVQQRVGLDGVAFDMFKFRTMERDAEDESGPVWAAPADPRRTRLGAFLRRFSLDELPQLWNVLRGDMSLVGPRPERPFFIEQFRREIPGYMLRHKVKAGVTGWAQVHGWRGATSLHERVEHDIYYIQNWSIGLDMRILVLTLLRIWRQRHAG